MSPDSSSEDFEGLNATQTSGVVSWHYVGQDCTEGGGKERERESESNPLLQPWRKKENERDWDLGSHV